jgi:hypothetical protein
VVLLLLLLQLLQVDTWCQPAAELSRLRWWSSLRARWPTTQVNSSPKRRPAGSIIAPPRQRSQQKDISADWYT